MKGVKGLLSALLFLTIDAFSHEIGKLISEYEEASQLYKKTRKESLGHLWVFKREDIERMQAKRLYELLRALPFFTLSNNRFGILILNEYGNISAIPKHIRLYINDHEVSSLHTGSPFLVWENLPLDMVEHVEIYFGIGAIELGNDPSTLIIKVYTKEAHRENASNVSTTLTSRKGYIATFYSAYELPSGVSYMFLVSDSWDNRKDYYYGGQELSRDGRYRYAFFGLYSDMGSVELGYGFIRRAPFIGFAMDGVAEKGYTRAEDLYLTLTFYPFPDKSTKIVVSTDVNRREHSQESSTGLFIPIFMDYNNPLNNPRRFYEDAFFHKTDIYASREFTSERNTLLTALSYKIYSSHIDRRTYITLGGNSVDVGETVPFNRQEIYSLILENKFSLNPSNLLIAGLKLDKYYRNGGFKDFEEFIARLGYISLPTDNISIKGFLARSYIAPYFYDTDLAGRDIDTAKIPISATLEGGFKYGSGLFRLGLGYLRLDNMIIPDNRGLITNSEEIYEFRAVSVEVEHRIALEHKISAGYNFFIEPETRLSPTRGGFLRWLFSRHKLSAFGEFIYRGPYKLRGKTIGEGYDLNAGVGYYIKENLSVSLKGENLLSKMSETAFYVPQGSEVRVYPFRERTLYLEMEWFF